MRKEDTVTRDFFEIPNYALHEAEELELALPDIAISHDLAIRLKRQNYSLLPCWDGVFSAIRELEIEDKIGLTFGLDPMDNDADPEVEMAPNDARHRAWIKHPVELAVHIDPTPSAKEHSEHQANVAVWVALLIAKELVQPDGEEAMLERFRQEKRNGKIGSWLLHGGVIAGNSVLQGAALGTTLHVLSWAGLGASAIGTGIYRARIDQQVEDIEGDSRRIVEIVDEVYREEAEVKVKEHPPIVEYALEY